VAVVLLAVVAATYLRAVRHFPLNVDAGYWIPHARLVTRGMVPIVDFDTAYAPDPDFAKAVAGLEVERETGKYVDPASLVVFQGYDNRCRKKLFGLVNCCKGAGGSGSLLNNLNLISGAGGQALGALGSSYTYDALFTSDAPDLAIAGFEALFGAGGGSSALAGLLAGEVSAAEFIGTLVPGPWTIVIIAIQLSGILDCEEAEQVLAMKRDNRLCHSGQLLLCA
jgi:conjugal transfer mating pair stabilization protein TraN